MGRRKYDCKSKTRRKVTREEDATWRLTHLLTASHLMAKQVPELSRFFMRTSSQIGRRINLTMDCMTVKRQVCKKCHTLLIPNGPTPCRVRISSKRETHVIVTCGHCGYFRRYLAREFDPAVENERREEKQLLRKRKREETQQGKMNSKNKNNNNNNDNTNKNKKRKLDNNNNINNENFNKQKDKENRTNVNDVNMKNSNSNDRIPNPTQSQNSTFNRCCVQ